MIQVLLLTIALSAASACRDRDSIVEELESVHNEVQVGYGVDYTNQLVELFASPQGTWTLIVNVSPYRACLIGSGTGWHNNNNNKKSNKGDPRA